MQYKLRYIIGLILLGSALANTAIAATAGVVSISDKEDKDKLQSAVSHIPAFRYTSRPFYGGDLAFKDANGNVKKLSELGNKVLLVDLWASWCMPCRKGLVDLNKLKQLSDANFDVVAINVDNRTDDEIKNLLDKEGINNLPLYRDIDSKIYQTLKENAIMFGLPTTLLFNKNHYLIGIISGRFDWYGDAAKNLVEQAKKLG